MHRRLLASVLVLAAVACGGEKLDHAPAPGLHTEVFDQNTVSRVDLLWVVDDSGSMADKQAKLAAAFQRFIDVFARGAIDYRIAVTTTDLFSQTPGSRGTFYGNPPIIRPTDDDPLLEFQQNIMVGTSGSGDEQGLGAAKAALDLLTQQNAPILTERADCIQGCASQANPSACTDDCQQRFEPDFLRPDAYLYVVFVSDEEDHSADEPLFYGRYLETVKGLGNEASVSASAIVGDPSGPTCVAKPGVRYAEVASYTGGLLGSICDASFDENLSRLATDAVGLKRHFLLGAQPKADTLDVKIDYRCDTQASDLAACDSVDNSGCADAAGEVLGLVCTPKRSTPTAVDALHPEGFTAGWSYACADNSITFHRDATVDAVPGLRSRVEVSFQVSKEAACSP